MGDSVRKDVKFGDVVKGALSKGQMDLSGFRIGKSRLVAKKKKTSVLKRVIIEEREERKAESSNKPKTAHVGLDAISSVLSLDAPEFVPSGWSTAVFHGQGALGKTDTPAPGSAVADGSAIAAERSTEETPDQRAPYLSPDSSSATSSQAPPRTTLVGRNAAPMFIPSWCEGDLQPEATPATWLDGDLPGELPISETLERMQTLLDTGRHQPQPKQKEKPRGTDIEVRHYVHQVLSDELDEKVKVMLGELDRFQERAKERDPLKYAKLKRFCVGMREARRNVARNKAKCLICAPNLEVSTAEGGLDDTVEDLIELARENEVPVIFALSRNRIGKALGKNIRLSIVALLSVEGVHQQFKEIIRLTDELRRQWVLRQMARVTSDDAEEARRCAAERAARAAERREEKLRLEAERKEQEAQRRAEEKAAREAAKARKHEERQAEAERRRAERAARLGSKEGQAEAAGREAERRAEEERRRAAELAAREAERQAERARREAEREAEEERRRAAERAAKEAAIARGEDEESDSDSDDSVPAGFNDTLF